ncbi:MAG: hypothetical protein KAH30_02500 [Caldisericia bacterium]|nr:hypothetical protein [Caldisericia bacterium]
MSIRETIMNKISVNPEKSELRILGQLFSYHCDKFNTRILKGFEDTLGYEKAKELLFKSSESTNYDALKGMFEVITGDTPEQKLDAIFEIYKVLGHGNVISKEISSNGGKIIAKSSYMVEGWLENEEKWNWGKRKQPICHDESGAIAAAFEIAYGLSKGSVKVDEVACSATGASECEFIVEVL